MIVLNWKKLNIELEKLKRKKGNYDIIIEKK